jgi:hypothetical protein
VELNCLEGSNKEGIEFMKAFDDSNALVYRRYVDPLWKLKRYFNICSEASLKKNIKIIDDFVTNLIGTKRKLQAEERLYVSVSSAGQFPLVNLKSIYLFGCSRTDQHVLIIEERQGGYTVKVFGGEQERRRGNE